MREEPYQSLAPQQSQLYQPAFSPSECEIAIGDAKTDLNARDLSNIANAQKVAACKIDMTTLSGLTNFTTPAYYLWGWHIAEIL